MEFVWVYSSTLGPDVEIAYYMEDDYFYDDFEPFKKEFMDENPN
jgi:hypothetical protein